MSGLDQRLEALRADREHGAQDLVLEALDLAEAWSHEGRDWSSLTAALRTMHPAIAMVRNAAERLAASGPESVEKLRRSLLEGTDRIAEEAAAAIPEGATIVTLSSSSTVAACLRRVRPAEVRVLESLPGGEGRTFAERLAAEVRTAAYPDADMARAVRGAACALVGADGFDDTGRLIHKVGTMPLALTCRYFRVPFYSAGHTLKQIEGRAPVEPEDRWFDSTPGSLVTAFFTEEGQVRFMM